MTSVCTADKLTAIKARAAELKEQTGIVSIPIEKILPWVDQPRKYFSKNDIKTLGESINQIGQKTPIWVTVDPAKPGVFLIIDGEIRYRASKLIGRRSMRAMIFPFEEEPDRLVRSFVANFGRHGHTADEIALGLKRIYDFTNPDGTKKFNVRQIAAMFAKSDCWVYQHLSLTKLDQKVISMLSHNIPFKNRLKFAIAILLTTLPGELQIEIAEYICNNQISMKAARHYVEVKALEKGHKVGGIASRPERRRESLMSLFTLMADSLPTFLNSPNTPLKDFLLKFPPNFLVQFTELAKKCQEGVREVCDTATVMLAEARTEREKQIKKLQKKKKTNKCT